MDPLEIIGSEHTDHRGKVRYVNQFEMSEIVRMYSIEPLSDTIRAWQGHRKENKWFFAAKGSFLVKIVNMDNKNIRFEYTLSESESKIIKIPGGYFNGFQALQPRSVLMIFSDFSLEQSVKDDYREELNNIPWI
ncbi:MAG: WxcM-like domain-containing protein [Brumimicrobium sp.]|nr:WxcM-like domain-containing protein [Brumimicrobium sp.]